MRAQIQLIDIADDGRLWAERYDFTDDDLFEAQDRIVADAVVEIDAAIDLGDMARARRAMPGSPEAYAIYQRAYALTTEGNPDAILRARKEWLKLCALERGRAPGLGGLVSCHLMEIRAGWSPDVEGGLAEATGMIDEALSIEPNFAFLHAMQGAVFLCEGRLDAALSATGRAMEIDPTYSKGIIYGSAQITLDRRRHIPFNGAHGEGRIWHTRHPESTTAKALAL